MELGRFLKQYSDSGISRFHMPGHKGNFPFFETEQQAARYDITEIFGADDLFHSHDVLLRLEERIAAFYGSSGAAISTGGSTLCIQTMLAASFQPGDTVIAVRNAHTAFINACALLDLRPVWVYPGCIDSAGVSGAASPAQIEEALKAHPEAKGVYLTSPDYLGLLSDIKSIARICHQKNQLFLVDNAHGAALKLCEPDLHPIRLGADICCDSAHKTLPVLTGGAFLHYSSHYSAPLIKEKMALFGSTSPSYLTMLSIDRCMDWLEESGKAAYRQTAEQIIRLKRLCQKYSIPYAKGTEPFRLSVRTADKGLDDHAAGAFFRACQIEPEYTGGGYTVFMASPFLTETDWQRLREALVQFAGQSGQAHGQTGVKTKAGSSVLFPREALLAASELIAADDAVGRVAAQTVISCPPGVPVLIPGEKITAWSKNILKNSGISQVKVVKW